ncbi:MAG: cytochrome c oxidase assembly protein subunit 15 [Flavobacteriales bacterium]|jgi:cytochrome c oxidase assembly protein subunit 15
MYLCRMTSLEKNIKRFAWISLIFVHLVILAGSVVRMTGSGMGCPDWPKCFGYAIPPTSEEQVSWGEDRVFLSGQMIVHNEELLIAQTDFTSGSEIAPSNWKVYEKHDYATFNPFHTWVEFINRFIGALTGIPVLILAFLTLRYAFKKRKVAVPLLGLGTLFMLGFEAWLGKLVVDGNLIPGSITIHMFGSILIVFLLLSLIRRMDGKELISSDSKPKRILIVLIIVGLLQVFLGTQVREEVDELVHQGVLDRSSWIAQLSGMFNVHRSFSWVVIALTIALVFFMKKMQKWSTEMNLIVGFVLFQFAVGVVFTYLNMPAFLQPAHLLGAIGMLGAMWSLNMKLKKG